MAATSAPVPALPPTPSEAKVRPGTLSMLTENRSFRNYWLANFFYFLVFGAQRFAFVLLVLELTDREGLAGVVGFALGVPAFFITVPAGVWADRLDRRYMVIASNLAGAAVLGVVALFNWTGAISPTLALVLALAVGFSTATIQPPLTAIVQMIVPPERLMNGIALRSMGQNLAQVFGSVLAGASIAAFGYGGAFGILTLLFLVSAGFMALVRLERPARPSNRPSMRDAATEGMRFVFQNRALRGLVFISVISGLFMLGPTFTLVPAIARDELGVGPALNSMLLGFTGIGMLAMSIFLATREELHRKGNLFVKNLLVAGPLIVVIGLSPWYALTALALFGWGLGGGIFINMNQTLIQEHTPNDMMGRVMSIYALSIAGLLPLGALLGGIGAEIIGANWYMALSGTILAVAALWMFLTQKELRALD